MYAQYPPITFSSACPFSCAVAAFATRLGGQIDPDFLLQCQILDPKFQKRIDDLKAVPLDFQPVQSSYAEQQDLFLDIDSNNQFYDSWDFKQHNSWLGSPEQWQSTYALDDDMVIDLI